MAIAWKCFWCGTLLNKKTKTKDHLVSRPLARKLKIRRHPEPNSNGMNSWIVVSCFLCNGSRAIITSLYNTAIGQVPIRREKSKKKSRRYMALAHQFRLLVVRKLAGYIRHLCLVEIDTVLTWAARNGLSCERCGGLVHPKKTACEICLQFPANEIG